MKKTISNHRPLSGWHSNLMYFPFFFSPSVAGGVGHPRSEKSLVHNIMYPSRKLKRQAEMYHGAPRVCYVAGIMSTSGELAFCRLWVIFFLNLFEKYLLFTHGPPQIIYVMWPEHLVLFVEIQGKKPKIIANLPAFSSWYYALFSSSSNTSSCRVGYILFARLHWKK